MAGLYDKYMITFLKKRTTVSQSAVPLYIHTEMYDPVSLHPCQYLVNSLFFLS